MLGSRIMTTTENDIERDLIAKLVDLKYAYRPEIRDRGALEKNFREKFEALNRVHLTDGEFQRLVEQIRKLPGPPLEQRRSSGGNARWLLPKPSDAHSETMAVVYGSVMPNSLPRPVPEKNR